jgi:hypothetical protein
MNTTTPNLALNKPTYDSDADNWGYLINDNADTLDALLASSAAGTFLPLAGGQMSGPLNLTATAGSTVRSVQDRFAEVVNVIDYGAKGDTLWWLDAVMTAGSAALSSSQANFTAADIGKAMP